MENVKRFNELKEGDKVNLLELEFTPLEMIYFAKLLEVKDKKFFLDSLRERNLIKEFTVKEMNFTENKIEFLFEEKESFPISVSHDEIVFLRTNKESQKLMVQYIVPSEDDLFEAILALYMAIVKKAVVS